MRKNFLRKKVFNTVRDTTNKVYLQTYDKLVNITKQGAPLELMRKKKKESKKLQKAMQERHWKGRLQPIAPQFLLHIRR